MPGSSTQNTQAVGNPAGVDRPAKGRPAAIPPDQTEEGDITDEAFTTIVVEHSDRIRSQLWSMLGNLEDVNDVTQDVFLKAWRSWLSKNGQIENLKGWLTKIATNAAMDALRHRRLITWLSYQNPDLDADGSSHNDLGDMVTANPANSSDVEQEVIARDEARTALLKMPRDYRVALLLHDGYGYSAADVAAELGLAESGVHMFLSRARRSFRECIAELEADPESSEHPSA